jgi:hypothetical protein
MWFRVVRETELTNPQLGAELLEDPKGYLPLEIFVRYVFEHSLDCDGKPLPALRNAAEQWQLEQPPDSTEVPIVFGFHDHFEFVLDWISDPRDPKLVHLRPDFAIQQALRFVADVIKFLAKGDLKAALLAAYDAHGILSSSNTSHGRGQPPTMRHFAVRAFIIRKFNPDPSTPGESRVSWAKLADMLFVVNGSCSRSGCRCARHQYNDSCVRALRTAVGRLQSSMLEVGIPV